MGNADEVGFAAGSEWRSGSERFIPDFALGPGDVIGFNADNYPTILGVNQQQANTWPNTYEVIGRDFFISANLRF